MPPAAHLCPACGVDHPAEFPHDASSVYYQFRFLALRDRGPTWADAIAHCTGAVRAHWEASLRECNEWSEPEDGQVVADPPAECFHQVITVEDRPITPAVP